MTKNKSIVCSVCGKENDFNNKFCSECGAKLQKQPAVQPRGKNKSGKQSRLNEQSSNPKVITSTQLIGIVVFLLAASGFLLVISGQFDTPEVTTAVNQNTREQDNSFAESHGGADLKTLQQIKDLEDIVAQNPGDLESTVKLAHLLNDNGFYKKALTYYEKYLAKKPKDVDVMIDMGVCYFELENYDKAIEVMEKAVSINPEHQIGNFNLGIVNFTANNPEKAKYWWKKAIEIDPDSRIGQKAKELLENN